MNFREKVRLMQARTGRGYHQICRQLGAAGGRKAAENKRRARLAVEKFHGEQKRQVARRLREPDEIPSDDRMTTQDRLSINFDQQKARVA